MADLKHYPFEHFNMNAPQMKFENGLFKVQKKFYAECVDMKDQAILGAVIRAAGEAGVTELYLLDKQFVMNALEAALEKWRGEG